MRRIVGERDLVASATEEPGELNAGLTPEIRPFWPNMADFRLGLNGPLLQSGRTPCRERGNRGMVQENLVFKDRKFRIDIGHGASLPSSADLQQDLAKRKA